jgi:hypothetical protein
VYRSLGSVVFWGYKVYGCFIPVDWICLGHIFCVHALLCTSSFIPLVRCCTQMLDAQVLTLYLAMPFLVWCCVVLLYGSVNVGYLFVFGKLSILFGTVEHNTSLALLSRLSFFLCGHSISLVHPLFFLRNFEL